ncbi:HesA/MoeB/ThiF family protein [Polaribacter tangerinus]|uniref:HesA/MoeB/ThiF family protein n=1 Tax=Polaribacter tangerinus TaxID=1920034 RepID=UPI000B4B509E|nr:HesA/MoeB/ThiF family protein [Polaribacter tangerinus]
MKPTKKVLFNRQITLSEIGEAGQEKLQNSEILVVGCGGLGGAIAVHLATSGIGKIHLIDFDIVTTSNLHRQVFYTLKDVGKYKVNVLAKAIKKRAPYTKITTTNKAIHKDNVLTILKKASIVVDGTDSLPTKYLLNDACVLLGKPLVYGSLYKFDGYVATFNIAEKNGNYSANLRDAFPEIATDIPNCEEAGTLNTIVGIIALQQVNEVLKLVTGIGKLLTNQILIYNTLQNSQLKMSIKSIFSKHRIAKIFENENYTISTCKIQDKNLLISADQLKEKLSFKDGNLEIIAVLRNLKLPFKVQQTISIESFEASKININFSKTYVMVCQKGINSYKATELLKKEHPSLRVFSLKGGILNYK